MSGFRGSVPGGRSGATRRRVRDTRGAAHAAAEPSRRVPVGGTRGRRVAWAAARLWGLGNANTIEASTRRNLRAPGDIRLHRSRSLLAGDRATVQIGALHLAGAHRDRSRRPARPQSHGDDSRRGATAQADERRTDPCPAGGTGNQGTVRRRTSHRASASSDVARTSEPRAGSNRSSKESSRSRGFGDPSPRSRCACAAPWWHGSTSPTRRSRWRSKVTAGDGTQAPKNLASRAGTGARAEGQRDNRTRREAGSAKCVTSGG